jgi:DNA-binding Xre family transcriptional regulator
MGLLPHSEIRVDPLEKICDYLRCQPGDLLRYDPGAEP